VCGEHDVITPPSMIKMFQSCIPHARLAEVAGSGHSVYLEKPQELNRILRQFLADVGVRRVFAEAVFMVVERPAAVHPNATAQCPVQVVVRLPALWRD
jgi:hypothetical protein